MSTGIETGRSSLDGAGISAPASAPLVAAPNRADRRRTARRGLPLRPQPISRKDWVVWGWLSGGCLLLFLLLFNPFWVPSGDGDLYVAIARSLALGEGYKFNGQLVNICPPGWPLILAGIMKISPTFAAFKLFMIVFMTLQLGMWYFLLRRLVPISVAAAAVAMTATLPHVYSLTFWTHSEAVYCLASTGAMLIAIQIGEGRRGLAWRVPLLLSLCVSCVVIRWAGTLNILLVGACLFHGQRWWRITNRDVLLRGAITIAAAGLAIVAFRVVREQLVLTREQEVAAAEAGAVFDEAANPQLTVESQKVDLINVPTGDRRRTVSEQMWRRGAESGRWFSWLWWQPFRFVSSVPAMARVDVAIGWIGIVVIAFAAYVGVRRREWIWLGTALYCTALVLNWPNANARYLVPVAPLLIAGVIVGLKPLFTRWTRDGRFSALLIIGLVLAAGVIAAAPQSISGLSPRFADWAERSFTTLPLWTLAILLALRWWIVHRATKRAARRATAAAGWAFVIGVFTCSGVLYAVDVSIARSQRFYSRYEAGFHAELVDACFQLNSMDLGDGDLAVSERYQNLGKARKSKYAVRAAALLTNRVVLTVQDRLTGEPPRPDLLRWCQRRKVVYYLHQQANVPWRVWHFVLPRSINERLTPDPIGPDSGGWSLYRLTYIRVPTSQPTTAPSMALTSPAATTQPSDALPIRDGYEYRRFSTKMELPRIRAWPTRVPGL